MGEHLSLLVRRPILTVVVGALSVLASTAVLLITTTTPADAMAFGEQTAPASPSQTADPVTAASTEGHRDPLVYHGRALTAVIAEIQPYIPRRIVVLPATGELYYSGLVKPEDVEAWVRDLPSIYPVEVIDCRASAQRGEVPECTDPQRLVIRPSHPSQP